MRPPAHVDAVVTRVESRVGEIASTSNLVHDQAQLQFQMLNGKYEESVGMYHSGGPAAALALATAPAPLAPIDPMAGSNEAWSAYLGKRGVGPTAFAGQTAFGGRPQTVLIGTPPTLDPPRSNGRWALYGDKYIMLPGLASHTFDSKSPQTWLQSTRDYAAGRTSELDPLLDWVESQVDPISSRALTSS